MKGIQLRKYVCVPTDDKKQRFEISGFCPQFRPSLFCMLRDVG